jgi:tRNA A-37 threonylcarbamoyl transferase component Bud32
MEIGTIVEERYRIEAVLGGGAMGRVYRARHLRLGREVAVKVLRDDLMREPAIVERFAREARVAARLRHPNLVSLLDVGEHLMVMELAPGQALVELTGAPMPRAQVVSIVSQLLRGLAHAHAAGLVHRDLKPENVLVDAEGIARIVDFGIAVVRDREESSDGRRLTDAGLVVGTPVYMSPEQAKGRAVDHRTDLFSLGVMMYELLAGAPPFEGTGAEVALANVTQDAPLIADRVRGVDVDPLLEAFVHKLMARRLDDRFASAHDALTTLELIDRDRDAAARSLGVLGGAPEPPPAVLRIPHDSDALATLPMEARPQTAASAKRERSLGGPNPSTGEARPAEQVRRAPRRWWPLAVAAAAVVAMVGVAAVVTRGAVVAGWPARPTSAVASVASSPALWVATVSEPVLHIAPTIAHELAPARVARTTALRTITPAIPSAVLAPAVPAPEVPQPIEDHSAAALVQRYREVGHVLSTEHASDEVWELYRRIQLHDAMATAADRDRAFEALAEIRRAATKSGPSAHLI